MIRPIKWHEECLVNSENYAKILFARYEQAKEEWLKLSRSNRFYFEQIEEAKRRGKKEFDSERFMIKRGDKK